MFLTLRYGSETALYSYSTDVRAMMIKEGFEFFMEHPILGGGYNYFYLRTSTPYDYSHCNYTEMLCTFGLIGTLVYYSKHFSLLRCLFNQIRLRKGEDINLICISSIMLIQTLVLDWAVVTFSAQSVWYIPVIFASVTVEQIHRDIHLSGGSKI